MRISDWSSDVCSSDLERQLHVFRDLELGVVLQDFERRHQGGRGDLAFLEAREDEGLGVFRGHAEDLVDPGETELPAAVTRLAARSGGAVGIGEPFAALLVLALRSEEHTSELQSLMRIS